MTGNQTSVPPRFCTYEDRPSCLVGIRLLVLSMRRYMPAARLTVWVPSAPPDFAEWLERQEQVTLISAAVPLGGWDVKPFVLLRMLEDDPRGVAWVDSDVLVARDPSSFFHDLDEETLVIAEEPRRSDSLPGIHRRAAEMNMPVGRRLPNGLNTCVLRVTHRHRPLLQTWSNLLADDAYRRAQTLPHALRPLSMFSDQEVLSGLLASTSYSHVPLRILRRGRDVIQSLESFGYSTTERLVNTLRRSMPPLIHAQGAKPWNGVPKPSAELSPYCWAAAQYRSDLGDREPSWLAPRSVTGRLLETMAMGNPHLRGLPLALARELRWLAWDRWVDGEGPLGWRPDPTLVWGAGGEAGEAASFRPRTS